MLIVIEMKFLHYNCADIYQMLNNRSYIAKIQELSISNDRWTSKTYDSYINNKQR